MKLRTASIQLALRAARVLNLLYLSAIALMLITSIIAGPWLFAAIGVKVDADYTALRIAMRTMMIVGIAGAVIAHLVLGHLLAIVASVRHGDPFVVANAQRLQSIAGWVLAGELLHLLIGALEWLGSSPKQPLDVDWSFSFAPWLAVLMLFVLARVFEHGAKLRADLEGTV